MKIVYLAGAGVALIETATALPFPALSPLAKTLAARLAQIVLMIMILKHNPPGTVMAGMEKSRLGAGIRTGLVWSFIFGLAAGTAGVGLMIFGINPLNIVASTIPFKEWHLLLFFVTGGVAGPAAEELFFRGILYGWLRRFSVPLAVTATTLAFAFCHARGGGIPVFQLIGGLIFALAFECSRSLAAPLIIHILGNLAIFSLSMI